MGDVPGAPAARAIEPPKPPAPPVREAAATTAPEREPVVEALAPTETPEPVAADDRE